MRTLVFAALTSLSTLTLTGFSSQVHRIPANAGHWVSSASRFARLPSGYERRFSSTVVTTLCSDGISTQTLASALAEGTPHSKRIYITVYNSHTHEADIRTYSATGARTPLTIVAGLSGPGALAVDRCGKLYVVNAGNDTVTTYDVNGIRTSPTIHTGDTPGAVAVGPDGKIYVLGGTGTVTTYDATGRRINPTIYGLSHPTGLAVDATGKIYITSAESCGDFCGIVTTYTSQGRRTVPTIREGLAFPQGLAFDATGKIYVANYSGGDITTYAPSGTPLATFEAPDKPLFITIDAGKIYYVGGYEDAEVVTETLDGVLSTPLISLGPIASGWSIAGIAVH